MILIWLGTALAASWFDAISAVKFSGTWTVSGFLLLVATAFVLYSLLFLSGVVLYFMLSIFTATKSPARHKTIATVCIIGAALFIYLSPYLQTGLLAGKPFLSITGALSSLALLIIALAAAFAASFIWRTGRSGYRFTAFVIILMLAGLVNGALQRHERRSLGKPNETARRTDNILLITIDTLNPLYISCYGNPDPGMPNIDALAEMGVKFEQMTCTLPRTGPSFASMMTGAYPAALGLTENLIPLSEQVSTLAEILYRNGYYTGAIVNNPVLLAADSRLDQGFADYDDNIVEGIFPFNDISRLNVINLLSFIELPDWMFYNNIRNARKVTEIARQWMEDAPQPFFYWLHYQDPHTPYFPPAEYRERIAPKPAGVFDPNSEPDGYIRINRGEINITPEFKTYMQNLYKAEVAFVDEQMGEIIDFLTERNMFDNTLVIFVGDHGENILHHKNYVGHGKYIYEEELRVPFIVIPPGNTREGEIVDEITEILDIFPTVLDYCGLDIPPQCQGESLMSLIEGEYSGYQRNSVYCETATMHRDEPGKQRKGIRTKEWKLFDSAYPERIELYNLLSDPEESHNLASQERIVVEELLLILKDKEKLMTPIVEVEHSVFTRAQKKQLRALGYAH